MPRLSLLSVSASTAQSKNPFFFSPAGLAAEHGFVRPLRLARLAAEASLHLQARNAQPVMRHFLIEHPQIASQLTTVAQRIVFETPKCFDELIDLHFRTVRQSVDPLKPDRERNAKRDRHTGTGADRNPTFGRHGKVASRMKKPGRSQFLSRGGRKKKRVIAQHRLVLRTMARVKRLVTLYGSPSVSSCLCCLN